MHPTHTRSLARFVESNGCTQATLFLKRENAHILRKHGQDLYKPARTEQISAANFLLFHF